jgi:hypothetical protein
MSPDKDGTIAAFCRRFPNKVARDCRLSEAGLVLAAFRATFVGNYALNVTTIRGITRDKGLGRDVIERGIAENKKAGYLERWQGKRKADGTFPFATEKLRLPECGFAGCYVSRGWFNGSLSLKELAGLLYLRAGAGKGSAKVFARELGARFGWSRPTAAKVIKGLIKRQLLVPTTVRKADGTFASTTYVVPHLNREFPTVKIPGHGTEAEAVNEPATDEASTVKNPGHGSPGHGFSGHTRSNTLHAPPSEDHPSPTTRESPRVGKYASAEAPPHSERAEGSEILLGWITSDDELAGQAINDVDPDAIAQVSAVVAEAKLRKLVREATEKRVTLEILTPAGLYAVRYLAASIVNDEVGPADALVAILNAMWARIGSRPGQWLNSLALIGRRFAGEDCDGCAQFYAENGKPKFRVEKAPKRAAAPKDQNLQTLAEADHAKTLAPRLLRDPAGLAAFLGKNGGEDALQI